MFCIKKWWGWQNTKIDSEKRRKFINDQLKHYKCACCGKQSPELINIRGSGMNFYLNSSEDCDEYATAYKPTINNMESLLGKFLNDFVMNDSDDFESAKKSLREEDLFKHNYI